MRRAPQAGQNPRICGAPHMRGIGISLLGIADSFISILGTVWEPEVVLDPKGLVLHGGGLLGPRAG